MQLWSRLLSINFFDHDYFLSSSGSRSVNDATLIKIVTLITLCPAQVADQRGDATLVKFIDSDYFLSSSGSRSGG